MASDQHLHPLDDTKNTSSTVNQPSNPALRRLLEKQSRRVRFADTDNVAEFVADESQQPTRTNIQQEGMYFHSQPSQSYAAPTSQAVYAQSYGYALPPPMAYNPYMAYPPYMMQQQQQQQQQPQLQHQQQQWDSTFLQHPLGYEHRSESEMQPQGHEQQQQQQQQTVQSEVQLPQLPPQQGHSYPALGHSQTPPAAQPLPPSAAPTTQTCEDTSKSTPLPSVPYLSSSVSHVFPYVTTTTTLPPPTANASANPIGMYTDPRRMQVMAKSVSITVNSSHNNTNQGLGVGLAGGNGGSMLAMSPTKGFLPVGGEGVCASMNGLTEEQEENKLVAHVKRRLIKVLLASCFTAWKQQWEQRLWKTQLGMREQQLQLMAAEVRHLEHRPVRYMKRYRLKLWFSAWVAYKQTKRVKRATWERTVARYTRFQLRRALQCWIAMHVAENADSAILNTSLNRFEAQKRRKLLHIWQVGVAVQLEKRSMIKAAEQLRHLHLARSVVIALRYLTWFYKQERLAVTAFKFKSMYQAFGYWKERAQCKKQSRAVCLQFQLRHETRLQLSAFEAWLAWVDGKHVRLMQEEFERLRSEHQRVLLENERLTRVIDSGDWGKDRVSELMQAGQVLQHERDALLKLVDSLPGLRGRRNSRVSQGQSVVPNVGCSTTTARSVPASRKGSLLTQQLPLPTALTTTINPSINQQNSLLQQQQNNNNINASVQAAAGGSVPLPPLPFDAHAQNRMFVKTGSSFNALVRALKQDLITSGALARDKKALYDIDKMSLSRLDVQAHGNLRVQAARSGLHIPGQTFGPDKGLTERQQDATSTASDNTNNIRPIRDGVEGSSGNENGLASETQSQMTTETVLIRTAEKLQRLGGRSVAIGKRLF